MSAEYHSGMEHEMSVLELTAKSFATGAHSKQKRKYTGEPYIVHPQAVAELVRAVPGHTDAMLAAAWLHDVVEDCGVGIGELFTLFGQEVGNLVFWLTDVSLPHHGNRAIRKSLDREHIAKAPREAKTIKLADLIDNTQSIVAYDPDFAPVYLAEKRALLEVLRSGDPGLWERAAAQVSSYVIG